MTPCSHQQPQLISSKRHYRSHFCSKKWYNKMSQYIKYCSMQAWCRIFFYHSSLRTWHKAKQRKKEDSMQKVLLQRKYWHAYNLLMKTRHNIPCHQSYFRHIHLDSRRNHSRLLVYNNFIRRRLQLVHILCKPSKEKENNKK